MILKNVCFASILVLSQNVIANQCNFLEQLSPSQKELAYKAYKVGQPYDLGLTTVAVAYTESKLGKYKVRFGKGNDVSVGIMHTAVVWKTKGMSAFERGMWVESMITDDDKALQVGISDLLKWKNTYKGDYKGMLNGYNAGYGKNPEYVNKVIGYVRELKHCNFK